MNISIEFVHLKNQYLHNWECIERHMLLKQDLMLVTITPKPVDRSMNRHIIFIITKTEKTAFEIFVRLELIYSQINSQHSLIAL